MSVMNVLKRAFPDKYNLYARADLLESVLNGRAPRIAIFAAGKNRRSDIKTVLEQVLQDPVDPDTSATSWFKNLCSRNLNKDTLVRYSSELKYIEVSNTLVEYPVPYNLPSWTRSPVEFLELTSSSDDTKPHWQSCVLHVFVGKSPTHLKDVPDLHYPVLKVLDVSHDDIGPNPNSSYMAISSRKSALANQLLTESAQNISRYEELIKESRIDDLKKVVFGTDLVEPLKQSLVDTAKQLYVESSKMYQDRAVTKSEIDKLRSEWSRNAHAELQGPVMHELDNVLYKDLAWYKLYLRVDEVYDILYNTLSAQLLPQANKQLSYINGRIDALSPGSAPYSDDISEVQARLRQDPIMDMHSKALRLVSTVCFGIQLPMVVVPLLGTYFYGYSLYAMGSLAGLGLVVGFRRLQKDWLKLCKQFRTLVFDSSRTAIQASESKLVKHWETKAAQGESSLKLQKSAIEELSGSPP